MRKQMLEKINQCLIEQKINLDFSLKMKKIVFSDHAEDKFKILERHGFKITSILSHHF